MYATSTGQWNTELLFYVTGNGQRSKVVML